MMKLVAVLKRYGQTAEITTHRLNPFARAMEASGAKPGVAGVRKAGG